MKRFLVPLAVLSGCANEQREERITALLTTDAGMPACANTSIEVIERIPGGGPDGSGLGMEVRMPERCLDQWGVALDGNERFSKDFEHGGWSAGLAECGEEYLVLHRNGPTMMRVGWITDFGGNFAECHE